MVKARKGPNFLLYGFILISMLIHFILFLHLAGILENQTISYIELSMQELSKPDARRIPRPRMREKVSKNSRVKTINVKKIHIPNTRVAGVETHNIDIAHERIDIPRLPGRIDISDFFVPGLNISGQVADAKVHEASVEFTNTQDYFEMLQLRIYSFKRYPQGAKSNHIEGRVKVQFVLSADGALMDIKVIKSSRHQELDDAALDAIKKASPFPRPPAYLFKMPVTLRINILFELV
jgi:protein TonB